MSASPSFPEAAARLLGPRFDIAEFPPQGPTVPRDRVLEFAKVVKEELGYRLFLHCTAVHHPATETEPERFRVIYAVRKPGPGSTVLSFQVEVPAGGTTPSLARTWVGADWEEREQFDLVGVVFEGHPDPRRLMMPEDWQGHPLRKDYAIDTPHFPWR